VGAVCLIRQGLWFLMFDVRRGRAHVARRVVATHVGVIDADIIGPGKGDAIVSPDRRPKPRRKPAPQTPASIDRRPSSDDTHEIVYFRRDADGSVRGREFLASAPAKVRATMDAVLIAVAKAPPK